MCGQKGLFEASLAELAGLSARRVAGLTREPWSDGFAAVYARAGFPAGLLLAFRSALAALARTCADEAQSGALRLSLVQAVLADCVGDGEVRAGQSDRAAAPVRTRRRPRQGPARCRAHPGGSRADAGGSAPALFGGRAMLTPRITPPSEDSGLLVDLEALERELAAA